MRMTLRAGGFFILIFVLAGCARQSTNMAIHTVSPTATPSVSTGVGLAPVVLPDCASSQLSIIDGRHGVAMGNVGVDGIAFKNVSTSACRLRGYPNIQLLDGSGKPITTHLNKGTSYTVQSMPEDVIRLSPGGDIPNLRCGEITVSPVYAPPAH